LPIHLCRGLFAFPVRLAETVIVVWINWNTSAAVRCGKLRRYARCPMTVGVAPAAGRAADAAAQDMMDCGNLSAYCVADTVADQPPQRLLLLLRSTDIANRSRPCDLTSRFRRL
jgi:hypothetical protein